MTKNILTVKEVADYLKVCPMTVYRYASSGKIPAFKIGSDWRFHKDSINKWIKSNEKIHLENNKGRKYK